MKSPILVRCFPPSLSQFALFGIDAEQNMTDIRNLHVVDYIVSSDMSDIALDVISAVALNCIYRDDLLTTLCVEADFSSTCTVIAVYAVSISLHLYLDDVVSSS